MSKKKCKGVVLNSTMPFGVVYEDAAKARFKHQTLMHDFQDLQKETDGMRSKLEAAKKRKLMLAAEVRFLRRKYEYFVKTKITGSAENDKYSVKQKTKKETHKRMLPPLPEPKLKKKRNVKEIAQNHKNLLHCGKMNIPKKTFARNAAQVLDLNQKAMLMHGVNNLGSRNNLIEAFDLNRDSNNSPSEKQASLFPRAPIFDLNEISMGDEDFQSHNDGMKFDEMKKSSIRGMNDDTQNDVKLSICRNAGEGSSRVGKRKISWMDPVALRV